MIIRILIIFMALSSIQFHVFAQSAGKIVGVVVDKQSGDPLPGANIGIDGATLGAASDVDGYYVILNVPVGVYDLRVNFIGYGEIVLTGIRVSANTTTETNFQLETTTIEGQSVIVITENRWWKSM